MWGFCNQDFDGFEIVIADDGSGDETRLLVERFALNCPFPLHHVWQEDNGFRKCRILNRAIEKAAGDYLIFTDGDCIPNPAFVRAHIELAKPDRFLSGGYCRLTMGVSEAITKKDIDTGRCFNPGWLVRKGMPVTKTLLKIGAVHWGIDRILNRITPAKRTFNGNNSSCFKKDAIRVNGFDERMHYGGEDREFGYRLENLGIKPLGIRYSAPCLHLEHARGYVDPELKAANRKIIDQTKVERRIETAFGLR